MTATPPNPPAEPSPRFPARFTALLFTNLLATGLCLVLIWSSNKDVADRLGTLEHRVRMIGFEATSTYEGVGLNALLDHLRYWAPTLQKSTAGSNDHFFAEERVEDIAESMSMLPDAYPQIEAAFLADPVGGDTTVSDEVRKWLLVAAHRADPKRGTDLIARALEAADFRVSRRLRRFAADELLQIDKKRAGEVLHTVLTARPSAATGRVGAQSKEIDPSQVFNYIDHYVASGHPEVEKTLLRMLQQSELHELITIQHCVEALGKMKSRQAMRRIEKLYWQQAPVPGLVPNPVFRRKCLTAIVETLGKEAVPFLREVDAKESDPGIQSMLNEYRKQFDLSPTK